MLFHLMTIVLAASHLLTRTMLLAIAFVYLSGCWLLQPSDAAVSNPAPLSRQRCSLPLSAPLPTSSACWCVHRQIICRGSQVDELAVENLFHNLSEQLPIYSREIDSFELTGSNVRSITPKV